MIVVSVMYPASPGTKFDMEYIAQSIFPWWVRGGTRVACGRQRFCKGLERPAAARRHIQ